MPDIHLHFYECDNPQCGMRFPGSEGQPRFKRCPVCRSTIHLVATVTTSSQKDDIFPNRKRMQVAAILDNIRSAWNVGSIFRTADGIGMSKLYLCGITPTPDNPKVTKTALGAETSLPWEKFNNGVKLAKDLKSKGYCLWAIESRDDAKPLFQDGLDLPPVPMVLIQESSKNVIKCSPSPCWE
jgi:23S rRNA (guanosine2251-2'-O)-methyltransferase